ncbi:MAG TPA: hypothetical protein PKC03_00685 [Dokdonella sp.]|nr:hypothetical protein [Dokdonella sp.]
MTDAVLERDPKLPEGRHDRRTGVRLLRRLVLYHLILAAGLLLAAVLFPDFTRHLPIGGVSELVEGGELTVGKVGEETAPVQPAAVDVLSASNAFDRLGYARQLAIILAGTWLLMLPIAWVHRGIHRASIHDHSLDETVLILPGIVAGIVLVVQHSLALAFSLAGIVAGVQFRRALQDTFDTLFILVAIGTGIAAGVRALEIAAVLTVFFTYSTLYVHYFGDGLESDFLARKKETKKQRKLAADGQAAEDEGPE